MLQFTYLPNGNLQITTDTADVLLQELMNQFSQGMSVVPRSLVPRNAYTPTMKLVVTATANVPKLLNPSYQSYEISPITVKVIARDADSFFVGMQDMYNLGYNYSAGSAVMAFGSYSAVSSQDVAGEQPDPTPVSDDVPTFNLDVALSYNSKEEVIAYCEQYGIEVDKRKTLAKIQNWLQSQYF